MDAFNLPDVLPFKVNYRLKREAVVKHLPANTGDARDIGLIPVGKIPWRSKWQPTPVFLPGKSHGQRSLAGCSL